MTEKEFMEFFKEFGFFDGEDDDAQSREEILNLIIKELYCKEREHLAERIRDSKEDEERPLRPDKDVDDLIVMKRGYCGADCGAYIFGQDLGGNELCSVCERRLSGEDGVLEKHQALSQSIGVTLNKADELVKEILIFREVNCG